MKMKLKVEMSLEMANRGAAKRVETRVGILDGDVALSFSGFRLLLLLGVIVRFIPLLFVADSCRLCFYLSYLYPFLYHLQYSLISSLYAIPAVEVRELHGVDEELELLSQSLSTSSFSLLLFHIP